MSGSGLFQAFYKNHKLRGRGAPLFSFSPSQGAHALEAEQRSRVPLRLTHARIRKVAAFESLMYVNTITIKSHTRRRLIHERLLDSLAHASKVCKALPERCISLAMATPSL